MPLVAVVLAALFAVASGQAALLHGTVYDLSLDPVVGAVVEVNTTPGQRFLSTDGEYSFDLQPGSYLLTAKKLSGDETVSSAEESILVEGEGTFVLDLILYPEILSEEELLAPGALDDVERDFSTPFPQLALIAAAAAATLLALIFMLFILGRASKRLSSVEIVLAALRHRKHASKEQSEEKQAKPSAPPSPSTPSVSSAGPSSESSPESSPESPHESSSELSPELSGLCGIISAAGGRMTQRDLRKELPYSEAKVSLMVAELEGRGILKKFKKGRGNIIVLAKEHPGGEHR